MPHRTLNVVSFSCSSAESWKKHPNKKNPINLVLAVSLQAGMIATDNYCFSSHYSKNTMYLFFFPFHSKNSDRCMEMTFLPALDS